MGVIAVLAGAVRVSRPYLYLALGETLTERAGRVNVALDGTLVLGAIAPFATSYLTGSPSLLFGDAFALGPALHTLGITSGYYLFNAAPDFFTLALLIWASRPRAALTGAPRELSISRWSRRPQPWKLSACPSGSVP